MSHLSVPPFDFEGTPLPIRSRKRGLVICFTGIEGSGKTTHAKSLAKMLSERGYSCVYVWGAPKPIFTYLFYGVTKALGFWQSDPENKFVNPFQRAPKSVRDRLAFLWRALLFIDFQIRTTLFVRRHLLLNRTVICDRYAFDLTTELMIDNQYSHYFGRLLFSTIPLPRITLLLDVPETLASSRRNLPPAVFSARRRTYLRLGRYFDFVLLDATADFITNFMKYSSKVLQTLNSA